MKYNYLTLLFTLLISVYYIFTHQAVAVQGPRTQLDNKREMPNYFKIVSDLQSYFPLELSEVVGYHERLEAMAGILWGGEFSQFEDSYEVNYRVALAIYICLQKDMSIIPEFYHR